jgi:hypothetical protein
MPWLVHPLLKRVQYEHVQRRGRRKERGSCQDLLEVVQEVPHQSTAWSTRHLRDSRVDLCSSSGAIALNISRNSSSSNSNTLVFLLHHSSKHHSGHFSSLHQPDTHASITGKLTTFPGTAAKSSRATHQELWHLRRISRGTNKGA